MDKANSDDPIPVIFILDENGEATGEVYPFCCEHCREEWIDEWDEKPADHLYKPATDQANNQAEGSLCCECLGDLRIVRRTHYKNGDEISLTFCGCDGCSPLAINGVLCHETGCPDAWRDYKVECFECGCEFYPDSAVRTKYVQCEDCLKACGEVEALPGDNPEPYGEPYIEIEYDLNYYGGDYSGTGKVAKIPADMVSEYGDDDHFEKLVHKAFQTITGHNPIHIVHYSNEVHEDEEEQGVGG